MSEQTKSNSTDQKIDSKVDTIVQDDCIKETKNLSKEYKYACLMETSGEECESWYYCIRYEGNEDNLKHLQDQLESVDWYILDDLSTFDLDLDHFVSETTAKELTKLELNHHSFHRKFDGVLDKVDLNLRKKDKNEKKMVKVFDVLGYGQIEDYVDREDLDEEDLTDTPQSSSEEEEDSGDESRDETPVKKERKKGIPVALQKSNLPRFARRKQRKAK
jgi:hypothetical protein